MSKMTKSIVFFGNEKLATGINGSCLILEQLIVNGYSIAALVINQQNADDKAAALPSVQLASTHSIPVLSPEKLADIIPDLTNLNSTVGVVAAYGRIIPAELLDIFHHGMLNIHPSLLPKYRGPTPIESAILNGDRITGVSLMRLSPEMDAGPIYAQAHLNIQGEISKQDLADRLTKMGAELLVKNLPKILDDALEPMSQNDNLATYCPKLQKADGQIDWQKPAKQIEREIRAYAGWPGSRTTIWGKEVIVTKAHLVAAPAADHSPGTVHDDPSQLVICAQDGCLSIESLKPIGKNEITAAEFIRGYKK